MEVSMKKIAVFIPLFALLGFSAFAFEKVQNLSLPAEGLGKLEITAGAGFLKVSGREGAGAVEVKAEIIVTGVSDKDMDEYIKDYVELELRKAGPTAVLVGRIREHGLSFVPREARIDLTVTVPKSLALEIDDGSGELSVTDIAANVRIKDGSGSLRVERIAGDLWIDDGSGEISVDDVKGNVDIIDGSGGMEVRNVTGDLSVDDGSGGIALFKIGGNVTIDDGSGHLEIDDVGKDVHLRHKGSGSVDITNVRGKVIK
jgi:hypothetical protein